MKKEEEKLYINFLENLDKTEKAIKEKINKDKHYCYILECRDNSYYTGYAKDPIKRLFEHNFLPAGAKYTSKRRPVHLKAIFEFDTRSDASKLEYKIKHLNRFQKEEIVNNFIKDIK